MFGSSKKQIVFNPSVYGNSSRRHRRAPRWLITFLAGVITGGGGFWFLETNYGTPRLNLRLQSSLTELQQEKNALEQQLSEAQLTLKQLRESQTNAAPTSPSTENTLENHASTTETALNPITPIQEETSQDRFKNLPADPNPTPIGVRLGNFQGSMGQLRYEIVLSLNEINSDPIPARVEITTLGHYRNGNKGFDQLPTLPITAKDYVHLQGQVSLSKPTLTPQTVEIKVIHAQTRKLLGSRTFEVSLMP